MEGQKLVSIKQMPWEDVNLGVTSELWQNEFDRERKKMFKSVETAPSVEDLGYGNALFIFSVQEKDTGGGYIHLYRRDIFEQGEVPLPSEHYKNMFIGTFQLPDLLLSNETYALNLSHIPTNLFNGCEFYVQNKSQAIIEEGWKLLFNVTAYNYD